MKRPITITILLLILGAPVSAWAEDTKPASAHVDQCQEGLKAANTEKAALQHQLDQWRFEAETQAGTVRGLSAARQEMERALAELRAALALGRMCNPDTPMPGPVPGTSRSKGFAECVQEIQRRAVVAEGELATLRRAPEPVGGGKQ